MRARRLPAMRLARSVAAWLLASALCTSVLAQQDVGESASEGTAEEVPHIPTAGTVASALATSGNPDALDLADVLTSVRTHHPKVLAALENEDVAAAELMAARGGFDPQLSVYGALRTGGYYELRRLNVEVRQPTPLWGAEVYVGYRLGQGIDDDRYPTYYSDETRDGGEVRFGARVPLWRDGPLDSRRAARQRGEIGVQRAMERRRLTEVDLRRAATDSYFRWLAAGRQAAVADRLLALARTRQDWVEARVAAGAIASVEALEARRSVLRRRSARVSATQSLAESALSLSLYSRNNDGAPSIPGDDTLPTSLALPPPIPPEDPANADLQCHPRVAQKMAAIESAEVSRALARAQRAPRLDAQVGGSRDFGQGSETLGGTVLEASLSLSMPLGLRTARGRLDAADSRLQALRHELQLIEDELRMRQASARVAERNARERFELASELLDTNERLAAAERIRFETGSTSLFIVNQREQALAQSAIDQVYAARAVWSARAAWQASSCD